MAKKKELSIHEVIKRACKKTNMRVGQLIWNVANSDISGNLGAYFTDIFYVSDKDLIKKILRFTKRRSK